MVSTEHNQTERVRSALRQTLESDTAVRVISSMTNEPIRFELSLPGARERARAPLELTADQFDFVRGLTVWSTVTLLGAIMGLLTQESDLAAIVRVAGIIAATLATFASLLLAFWPSLFELIFVGKTKVGGVRSSAGAVRVP